MTLYNKNIYTLMQGIYSGKRIMAVQLIRLYVEQKTLHFYSMQILGKFLNKKSFSKIVISHAQTELRFQMLRTKLHATHVYIW